MIQRKIVLNIFEMGLPEDVLKLILGEWFSDDMIKFSYENVLTYGYYDILGYSEDRNFIKNMFLGRLVQLGIDLQKEEYIILHYGSGDYYDLLGDSEDE